MYLIPLPKRIRRLLKTPLGSRVMRPEYGSELYKLRDRPLNEEFKVLATKYIFEAIKKNEPSAIITKIDFKADGVTGVVGFKIYLKDGEKIKVEND